MTWNGAQGPPPSGGYVPQQQYQPAPMQQGMQGQMGGGYYPPQHPHPHPHPHQFAGQQGQMAPQQQPQHPGQPHPGQPQPQHHHHQQHHQQHHHHHHQHHQSFHHAHMNQHQQPQQVHPHQLQPQYAQAARPGQQPGFQQPGMQGQRMGGPQMGQQGFFQGQAMPHSQMPPMPHPPRVVVPHGWVNPVTGKKLMRKHDVSPTSSPPVPTQEAEPAQKTQQKDEQKKAAAAPAPAAAAKSCGCKKRQKDADHHCVKFCGTVMGCNGSCGFPGENPNRGTVRPKKGTVGVPAKVETKPKPAEKKPEAPQPQPSQQQQQQQQPQQQPQQQHQTPQQSPHQQQPVDPQMGQNGMGVPPMQGHLQSQQMDSHMQMYQSHPHPHQQHPHPHPHQMQSHDQGYNMHGNMHMGMQHQQHHQQQHPQQMGMSPMQQSQPSPQQQPMQGNAPQVLHPRPAGAPAAKRESRAVPIVPPEGDPRATKIHTFDQLNVAKRQAMSTRHRIPQLEEFQRDYSRYYRTTGMNVIIAGRTHQSERENVLSTVKGILNKATPEKMDLLRQQMCEVIDRTIDAKNNGESGAQAQLDEIVRMVYEEAIAEKHFSKVYAEMCHGIAQHNIERLGVKGNEEPFRRALIQSCQTEYQNTLAKLPDDMDPQKREKLRRRARNNVHFVGELYKQRLLVENTINQVIGGLIKGFRDDGDLEKLDKLIDLLKKVGPDLDKLDKKKNQEKKMEEYFEDLRTIRENLATTRHGFLLQELLELRQHGWLAVKQGRREHAPVTIHEMEQRLRNEEFDRARLRGRDLELPTREITLREFHNGFCLQQVDERFTNALTRMAPGALRSLLENGITTALTEPDRLPNSSPPLVLANVGKFLNHVVDSDAPLCEILQKVVSEIVQKGLSDQSWQAWNTFLGSISTHRFGQEAGSVAARAAIDFHHDVREARHVIDSIVKISLESRAALWVALHAVASGGDDRSSRVQYLLQELGTDEGSLLVMSTALGLTQTPLKDVLKDVSDADMVFGLLSAEMLQSFETPDKVQGWPSAELAEALEPAIRDAGKAEVRPHIEFFRHAVTHEDIQGIAHVGRPLSEAALAFLQRL